MYGRKNQIILCALIICDGALLIVKRSALDRFLPNAWDFPGGGVEKGETLVSALIREVKEEINVDISTADIELIGVSEEISKKEEIKREIQFNYEIVLESRVPVVLNSEHSAYDWIDKCDDRLDDWLKTALKQSRTCKNWIK